MSRIRYRLTASALLFLAAAPGCRVFDRDREPLCPRLNALFCGRDNNVASYPVTAPAGDCNTCGPGMPMMGGPVISGPMMPGQPGIGQPIPPSGNVPLPKIPSPGIKESEGKQFELESSIKGGPGPVLAVPAGGAKMR